MHPLSNDEKQTCLKLIQGYKVRKCIDQAKK